VLSLFSQLARLRRHRSYVLCCGLASEAIWRVGRLLRQLHDATVSLRPTAEAVWQPWSFHRDAPGSIIGHCDTGPWHIVARDGLPMAFIDWTLAGPTDRRDEVAATGWWNAQLYDEDIAEANHLADAGCRVDASPPTDPGTGHRALTTADPDRRTGAHPEYRAEPPVLPWVAARAGMRCRRRRRRPQAGPKARTRRSINRTKRTISEA
jgi:hypothetical protein